MNHAAPVTSREKMRAESLRVEFVTELAKLEALGAKWEELNGRLQDHEAPFFQSHAWSLFVARVRLERSANRYRPLVATVWRDNKLVGIWPLSQQSFSGSWVVRNLDDPFGQFAGVLFEHREDIGPGVAAILDAVRARRLGVGLQIGSVVEGTPLHHALARAGGRHAVSNHAVSVDLRPFASIGEFRNGLNKKTLKNIRNLHNRMRRTLPAEHVVAGEGAVLERIIPQTFDARMGWMHTHGRTSPAFRNGDFRPLAAGLFASGIQLLGFVLGTDETFLSAQWGFTYLGRYYAFMSAKNHEYDQFSPGRVHLGMVIEACKERHLDVLELMAPPSEYKLTWSNQTKRLDTFFLPFNLRGRLLLYLGMGKIGPAIRSASRLLPRTIRNPLVHLLNRR